MLNATQARKLAQNWMDKATKEHERNYNQIKKQEKREALDIWKKRGIDLVKKIDAHIQKQANNGQHNTYMPSRINPDGDLVIWLEGEERKIHSILMDHYREQGFEVEEYSPFALKIEW